MTQTAARTLDPDQLDFSMFGPADLANIVLQRSQVLRKERLANPPVRAWSAGDGGPLEDVVRQRGSELARRASGLIAQEFETLRPWLDRRQPARVADIGCGYAIFDLFVWHAYKCDLLLIDIEENERRTFGFADEAAAYTSLATAREFLVANGVPEDRVTTWNPKRGDKPEAPPVDLAVSLLSCGFHYPVDAYLSFFETEVVPGGAILLDLREKSSRRSMNALSRLGDVETVVQAAKYRRVLVTKPA